MSNILYMVRKKRLKLLIFCEFMLYLPYKCMESDLAMHFEEKNSRLKHKEAETKIKNDKNHCSHIIFMSAVLSCVVLTVILVIFSIVTTMVITSLNGINQVTESLFIAVVWLFNVLLSAVSYILVKRFAVLRAFYIVLVIILVVFMLINYNSFWFDFSDLILYIVDNCI